MSTNAAGLRRAFHVITGETVHGFVFDDVEAILDAVQTAYVAHHAGLTVNPDSHFLRFPMRPLDRIIALPAYIESFRGGAVAGIKWISSFPKNIDHGMPRASAVMILNDAASGYPIACLEGSVVSAARTAASAVVGAFQLNRFRKEIDALAVIGAGLIARYILEFFVRTGWRINELNLHDIRKENAEALSERFTAVVHGPIKLHESPVEAMRSGTVVVFATTAASPYIFDQRSVEHNPLILHISLRDLSPEIILACENVVDDVEHCLKADTSAHLAEKQVGHRNFVRFTLPSILSGGRIPDARRPIVFSPFGMGILDVAVGSVLYQRALLSRKAVEIREFFFEEGSDLNAARL
ncbi:2,3-diaminopropionate biosynthesis protein SbnB [Bradyrhizobium sp. STM 3562]|uniref:2,3-diaminopropionate biosynthesis protein SbnB n=1 Tax=Bradyrhizobium sp. STM 3562 TaxID=578924 RepID=UPI00388EA2DE